MNMLNDIDRLTKVRDEAKRVYNESERALASARYVLNFHERALQVEWDKFKGIQPITT